MKRMSSAAASLIALVAVFGTLVGDAQGQEGATTSGIQTVEEREITESDPSLVRPFEQRAGAQGRVDQRHDLNPLSDRLMGWSSGYLPPAGVFQYTNTFLAGNKLAYSPTDDFQVFAEAFLPFQRQTYASVGAQFKTLQDDSWHLTVGTQLRYRRTNLDPGTTDTGLGVHAVVDVVANSNLSWSVGGSVNVPLMLTVEEIDFSGCETRSEFASGACYVPTVTRDAFPGSGYWFALYGGLNYFATDWLILNVEAFTGVSQGNFFGLEPDQRAGASYDAELNMVRDSSFRAGLGPLGPFTLGVGTTFVVGPVGIQTGLYFASYGGEPITAAGMELPIPYFAVGSNFGGRQ